MTDSNNDSAPVVEPASVPPPSGASPPTISSEKQPHEIPAQDATPIPSVPSGPSGKEEPTWPDIPTDHPLAQLFAQVEQLTTEAGHDEVYGIRLSPSKPFLTKLILQKFLRANANDVTKAEEQLLATLKWRKEFDPLAAVDETFSRARFGGLGFMMTLDDVPESANKGDVVTFNVYGAVKDNKTTFGDLDGFLRWRVALMERSIHKLKLADAKEPIPDYGAGPDPYQGYQVHDYLNVSFFRMDPDAKTASRKTVELLQKYYPETLSRKFFVNVPVVMGWVFSAMKLFVARETMRKFTVLSYSEGLAAELGKDIPKAYGGEKGGLEEIAETLKLS